MKKLIFGKLISRDWSLMFSEDLHFVNTRELREQFGWHYTEMIFEGKEGVVNVYCSLKEQEKGLTGIVLEKMKKNGKWLSERNTNIRRQFNDIASLIRDAKKKPLEHYSNNELANLLKVLSEKNIESHAYYAIMIWVPVNMEKLGIEKKHQKFINEVIQARAEIHDVKPEIDNLYLDIGSFILTRSNIPMHLSKYLSFQDVFDFLLHNKDIDENELLNRKRYYIITNDGILNEKLESYIERKGFSLVVEKKEIGISELKGKSASFGIVSGYAKIVLTKREFDKVKHGDILISHMTTPDFINVVKKASAIVTDEGGVTSHAAIISREFNIPCVVGTKKATQIIKDNDFIQVNAEKGVVKKIE